MIEPNGVQVDGRDMVNNPSHYNKCGIECIELIELIADTSTLSHKEMYWLSNILKYIYRSGHKEDAEQDLKKAEWYWNRLIDHRNRDGKMRKSVIEIPSTGIGDLSDGYHTFNELYHHRAILFSVICNNNKEIAWKSRSHHDGSMYSNMFIVGINTPKGQATYHYDVNPYWGMFDVQELEFAPEWDGHTPDQAIERINTLSKLGRGRL